MEKKLKAEKLKAEIKTQNADASTALPVPPA
jgi:hypothetical protein